MSEWDSSVMDSSSFENPGKIFERPGCLSEASRNSGLLVTVPELIRNIAPMRYGLLTEEFYKSSSSETMQSAGNERTVPSSSLSKLFFDDDEVQYMGCQSESFHVRSKFFLSLNSAKSNGNKSSCTSLSNLLDKDEGMSQCHSKMAKIGEVPVWEPTLSLFRDTERDCTMISGRKVHRVIFSPAQEGALLFSRNNRISTASLASYRGHLRTSRTSTFFDRFRHRRIPRATARKFLINRDPKYKAKYG
uniref:Bm12586 n=1 Tax=Brugia malayi TaxID=6279 RepID=A0A1I9GBF3_BRUMA|nr:Bm12586 [Brugia malayi]